MTVAHPWLRATPVGHPRPWRMLWITTAWGSCFVGITIALEDAPVLWLAALRALIAGAALALLIGIQRVPIPRDPRTWALVVCLGAVNIAVVFATMFGAATGLSTGIVSVLANAQPILILLPAWWIYRERPTPVAIVAIALGFAGLLVIVLPVGLGSGAWIALTSAAATTAGTLIGRIVQADPRFVAAAQLLIGGALLAGTAAFAEGPPRIYWSIPFLLALLFLSLVGTAATTVAWFTETRRARLDILAAWTLLVPVFGVLLSLVVLREDPGLWGWIGIVIVLISMALLAAGSRRRFSAAGIAAVATVPRTAEHATPDSDGRDESHRHPMRPERKHR